MNFCTDAFREVTVLETSHTFQAWEIEVLGGGQIKINTIPNMENPMSAVVKNRENANPIS